MPEKRTGVFDIIMGVFKGKKEYYGDIVTEAENVVANYIYCRRNIVSAKHKKKNRYMKFLIIAAFAGMIYVAYKF